MRCCRSSFCWCKSRFDRLDALVDLGALGCLWRRGDKGSICRNGFFAFARTLPGLTDIKQQRGVARDVVGGLEFRCRCCKLALRKQLLRRREVLPRRRKVLRPCPAWPAGTRQQHPKYHHR